MAFLIELSMIKTLFSPRNSGHFFVTFYKLSKNSQRPFIYKLTARLKDKTAV